MNDNRITTVEAARLCGLTRQAITARIKRNFYRSAARLGRDWTLDRTEVEASANNPPRVGRKRKLGRACDFCGEDGPVHQALDENYLGCEESIATMCQKGE